MSVVDFPDHVERRRASAEAHVLAMQLLAACASEIDAGLVRLLGTLLRLTGARFVRFALIDLSLGGDPLPVCIATAGATATERTQDMTRAPVSFECPVRPGRVMRLELSFENAAPPDLRPELERWTGLWRRWLFWLDLSHGPIDGRGLMPPHHRRVLLLMLKGLAEKQIAAQLGQSIHTTHQYVKCLYRRFGVRNRASLMALWLRAAQAA